MVETLIIERDIGGQPKTRYWTPDGRELLRSPCMRTTKNGGVRDANFDFGWLPIKPTQLKLYCPHCDKWHDTDEEVKACGKQRKAFDAKFMRIAKKQTKNDGADKDKEIESLRSELAELKEMITRLAQKE